METKKFVLTSLSVGVLALVGCEEEAGSNQIEEGESSDELSDGEIEELLNQAIENNDQIESYGTTLTQEIVGVMDGDESEINTEMEMELASVHNMRISMEFDMVIGDVVDDSVIMEMILVDDMVYYDLGEGTWHQDENLIDTSEFEGLEDELSSHHFNELLDYIDQLQVYDEGDTYRIVMHLEGEEAQSFSTAVDSQADVLGDQPSSDLEGMGIYDLEYELILDQETLWQTEFTMNMAADGETDGFTLQADIYMHGTFFDYNEVDPIEAPE